MIRPKQKRVGTVMQDASGRSWVKSRSLPPEEFARVMADCAFDARFGVVGDDHLARLGWDILTVGESW